MPRTKTHKGVKIVPVKITRHEVRDLAGKTLATFTTSAAARAWISGYLAASARARKPVAGKTDA